MLRVKYFVHTFVTEIETEIPEENRNSRCVFNNIGRCFSTEGMLQTNKLTIEGCIYANWLVQVN